MRHALRQAELYLVGGLLLAGVLMTLFTLDMDFSGRATSATRVNITNSTPANCTIVTYTGRNSISIPCMIDGTPFIDAISNETNISAVYQYVPGGADLWKVRNVHLPSYVVSDLRLLSRRIGYVFIMNASESIQIEGFKVETTSVPMVAGWNLVGYPSFATKNASDSFAGIDNFTEARTYDNLGATYLSYLNPGGGTLLFTIPGQGYWVNATNGLSWTVTSS